MGDSLVGMRVRGRRREGGGAERGGAEARSAPRRAATTAGPVGRAVVVAFRGSGRHGEGQPAVILRRYVAIAIAYATTRIPTHQARAIQMSPLTGCCSNRARIVSTIGVTGWCSANH